MICGNMSSVELLLVRACLVAVVLLKTKRADTVRGRDHNWLLLHFLELLVGLFLIRGNQGRGRGTRRV